MVLEFFFYSTNLIICFFQEELKAKHQEKMDSLKEQYENILKENISKVKAEEEREKTALKTKIEFFNTNYMKVSDHEMIVQSIENKLNEIEKQKKDVETNFGETLRSLENKDFKLTDAEVELKDAKSEKKTILI